MKVSELARLIDAKTLTPGVQEDKEVLCGYTCDLLSWVMAHGVEGMAWVTVQIHMNVIAVAVLAEMACVILPENIEMPPESLKKAEDEGLTVLQSPLTAFAICGRMAAAGIPDKAD
ncbi:MAG: AraC family transcriptional regulator [Clostridiales bacterium]|nr:AraC family transcriptional regulator [Clostridiales bacterium]